jgi:hypothetical protein
MSSQCPSEPQENTLACVIPAKAGILMRHEDLNIRKIPAFAGMTQALASRKDRSDRPDRSDRSDVGGAYYR